jgi:phosphatidylserine/phosphatidylglycerophosphate/cardiolipin synthase-like enzyme
MPTLAALETKYFPSLPTSPPYSGDTEVIAHVDGVAYFAALAAAIDATKGVGDVIYMVNWYLDEDVKLLDPAPPSIKDLLAQKAADGVDVKIVIWTGRNQLPDNTVDITDIGYWTGSVVKDYKDMVEANMVAALTLRSHETSPGVTPLKFRVLMDWSGSKTGSRHQKYAVVYSKSHLEMRAFVGGIDIGKDRQATPDHPDAAHNWHDLGVELIGEAARGVWLDFKIRWMETLSLKHLQYIMPGKGKMVFNPGLFAPVAGPGSAVTAPITPTTTKSVRIVRTYGEKKDSWDSISWDTTPPGGGLQEIFAVYQKAINSATRYIYVEDQGLNNPSLITAHQLLYPLIGNATRRGVKVLFVCPGDGSDFTYSRSLFQELGLAPYSANFRMCRVDGVYVHSKVVLIDDEFAAVGSANFWDRSMDGTDTELTVVMVDTGPFVKNLRVQLLAEHLRVDANDTSVRGVLEDVDTSFGLFGLGTYPGGFRHPDSRLYEVRDTIPSRKI